MDPATDDQVQELACEAGAGDVDALDRLLTIVDEERWAVPAIRRVLAGDTDVDDVAQDTLIAVAESIPSYRAEAPFRSWLAGIARNQALEHVRRSSRRRAREDRAAVEPSPRVRMSSMVATRSMLEDAIATLPDHYRDAVVLRDADGLSYDQVAGRLGVPVNTVRSRIARGRAMLAAGLTPSRST